MQSHPSTVEFSDVAKSSKAFATMFSKRVRPTHNLSSKALNLLIMVFIPCLSLAPNQLWLLCAVLVLHALSFKLSLLAAE